MSRGSKKLAVLTVSLMTSLGFCVSLLYAEQRHIIVMHDMAMKKGKPYGVLIPPKGYEKPVLRRRKDGIIEHHYNMHTVNMEDENGDGYTAVLNKSALMFMDRVGNWGMDMLSPAFEGEERIKALADFLKRGGVMYFGASIIAKNTSSFLSSLGVTKHGTWHYQAAVGDHSKLREHYVGVPVEVDHPLLTTPNKLTEELLAPKGRDNAYFWWLEWAPDQIPLLADREDPRRIALIAHENVLGKGTIIFSMLSGVPDALFENLLHYGSGKADGSIKPVRIEPEPKEERHIVRLSISGKPGGKPSTAIRRRVWKDALVEHHYHTYHGGGLDLKDETTQDTFTGAIRKSKMLVVNIRYCWYGSPVRDQALAEAFSGRQRQDAITELLERGGMICFFMSASPTTGPAKEYLQRIGVEVPKLENQQLINYFCVPLTTDHPFLSKPYDLVERDVVVTHDGGRNAYYYWTEWGDNQTVLYAVKQNLKTDKKRPITLPDEQTLLALRKNPKATVIVQENVLGKGTVLFCERHSFHDDFMPNIYNYVFERKD